ncbi:transcription elongation regulator [Coemansia erecta]|uniref:Transcription elongation regulator n=1 Tax=Coemansia erecta TaxID=147472 RepID=A0A9W7XWT4_9FUNG|nr:transcription elongation regulator [Coemansia erecta]
MNSTQQLAVATEALLSVDTGHTWSMFFAPANPLNSTYLPSEPYYHDAKNNISTWKRPFNYRQPAGDPKEIARLLVAQHIQEVREAARRRAKEDRPLRQHRVSDQWSEVTTVQGRTYYYNEKSGQATWERPAELEEGEDGEEEEEEEEGVEMDEEDAEWMMQQMLDEQEEAEAQQADEDEAERGEPEMVQPEMSRDDRIRSFREMLREGSLNVFGTWESQMSEFAKDRRFHLVDSDAERQDLFDQACSELLASKNQSKGKNRGKGESSRKRDHSTEEHSTDPFGQLLIEAVTKKMSFARFCQKHLKDPRYLALKTSREREKRFLQHLDSINTK